VNSVRYAYVHSEFLLVQFHRSETRQLFIIAQLLTIVDAIVEIIACTIAERNCLYNYRAQLLVQLQSVITCTIVERNCTFIDAIACTFIDAIACTIVDLIVQL
jgi:hypothetical protein